MRYETLRAHCIFSHTRTAIYLPIFHTLYFTLYHACVLIHAVLSIEMAEILDGRIRIAF